MGKAQRYVSPEKALRILENLDIVERKVRRKWAGYFADLNAVETLKETVMGPLYAKRCVRFTGGLSWGDSPSDVFDDITMLTQIDPIYRQLESWAVADYQTEG